MLNYVFKSNFILDKIKKHALQAKPEECCGLIFYNDGNIDIYEARNISSLDKRHSFTIHPLDLIKAEAFGKIVGYYHSHNSEDNNGVFSELDIYNYRIHGVCSIIYNTTKDQFYFLNSEISSKYVGKPFRFGESDCYSIIKDYYKNELNVEFADYPRDSKWRAKNPRIWLENFEKEGMRVISHENLKNLKKHDVIMMAYYDTYPSHGAIYLGGDLILHHPGNKFSTIEPLNAEHISKIYCVLRHKSLQ